MPRIYTKRDPEPIRTAILKLANEGGTRPPQSTIEGQYLAKWICDKVKSYDVEFDTMIRKLRPDWFKKPRHNSKAMKEELLALARKGMPRPRSKQLTNALNHYAHNNNGSYDADFSAQIYRLAPHWFIATSTNLKKSVLLMAAEEGAPRPDMLERYVVRSSRQYDANFAKMIRELRPDWFMGQREFLKHEILEWARAGKPQPSEKNSGLRIYRGFRRYTRRSEEFDPHFTYRLMCIRPEWFDRDLRKHPIDQSTAAS